MVRKLFEGYIRKMWQRRSLINYILLPFSLLYLALHYLKMSLTTTTKVKAKVVCVGNLAVGGGGKTSFCLALAERLNELGIKNYAFVSKGYGREPSLEPFKVTPEMSASFCGDEPLLLSAVAPTYVGNSRVEAAELAIVNSAKLLFWMMACRTAASKRIIHIV